MSCSSPGPSPRLAVQLVQPPSALGGLPKQVAVKGGRAAAEDCLELDMCISGDLDLNRVSQRQGYAGSCTCSASNVA